MPQANPKMRSQASLPPREIVLAEEALTPSRPGAGVTAALEGAPGTTYRIIRTQEVDEYEKPLQAHELASFGLVRMSPAVDTFEGTKRKAAKLTISAAAV